MNPLLHELATLRDWLRWAVSRFHDAKLFYGHGTNHAYDEAAWLILSTLHLPHDSLNIFLDARLTVDERLAVFNILDQRIQKRLPAAYLTHEAWLGDFRFYVDERVIVPRSYFAGLLENRLAPWVIDPDTIENALDLCTGSGCLAILMAHAFPAAKIDAVDLYQDALEVALRNVTDYGLTDQIHLKQSDLFENLADQRYDLIVCNPPYVTAHAMANLPSEYRHEPVHALAAGLDGLDIVRRLMASAQNHLTPNGLLFVEVGHNASLAEAAFPDIPLTWIDTAEGEAKIFMLTR